MHREIEGKQTKDPFAACGQRGDVTTSCSWSHPFRSKVGGTNARGWFSDSRAVSSADTVAALCRPHTGLAHLSAALAGQRTPACTDLDNGKRSLQYGTAPCLCQMFKTPGRCRWNTDRSPAAVVLDVQPRAGRDDPGPALGARRQAQSRLAQSGKPALSLSATCRVAHRIP